MFWCGKYTFAIGRIDLRGRSMWALAERAHHGGPSISDKLGCAAAIADLYPHCSVVLLLLECLQDVCDELYGVL